ncbi:MAG: hypothetical protein EA412_09005 [Chitinophagaceae bacterium]|nr:MAG: hypothetical protein EA412_09005 [Chitinophagaceae bacterium]
MSCSKDEVEEKEIISADIERVFIINEGNFQWGNAGISLFLPDSNKIIEDYYQQVNNQSLGDVALSMISDESYFYIVVNNSSKIEVVDKRDFKRIETISGFNSPRYIVKGANQKAYVSDLYEDAVYVIDLLSRKILKQIPLAGWTEEMLLIEDKLYVTNLRTDYLYIIDVNTDELTDSIYLACKSYSLIEDNSGKLWVLCPGSSFDNEEAFLISVNPVDNQLQHTISFSPQVTGVKGLQKNAGGDKLFYAVNNDIFKKSAYNFDLPQTPFIESQSQNIYDFFIHPVTNDFYVLDAKDYNSRGALFIYDSEGNFKEKFKTGIIPTFVYFERIEK